MDITREQYETDIRKAKAEALRDFADKQDIPQEEWEDLTPGMRGVLEDRHFLCSLARRRADELDSP